MLQALHQAGDEELEAGSSSCSSSGHHPRIWIQAAKNHRGIRYMWIRSHLNLDYQMSIFISNIRPDSKFSIRPENSALWDISPNIRLFFIPGCSGYLDRILYPAYLISSPCLNLPKLGVTSERNI